MKRIVNFLNRYIKTDPMYIILYLLAFLRNGYVNKAVFYDRGGAIFILRKKVLYKAL